LRRPLASSISASATGYPKGDAPDFILLHDYPTYGRLRTPRAYVSICIQLRSRYGLPTPSDGFSLIELLAVVGVMSVLLGLLGPALRGGTGAQSLDNASAR